MENKLNSVIVTGGSSGIGFACCERLSQSYAHVIALDIQAPQQPFCSDSIEFIPCDVTDQQAVTQCINNIGEKYQLDGLCINAGRFLSATIEDSTLEEINSVIDINLKGAIHCLQASLPLLRTTHGNVVLIGSDQSFIAKPGNSIYGATKGAIAQLTKAVALENAHYPVRVNCVCPGTIDTPLYRYAVERFVARTGTPLTEIEQELNQAQPLGRIGQASEVANVVDFLLSSQASFITGALIPVDGGYIAQ